MALPRAVETVYVEAPRRATARPNLEVPDWSIQQALDRGDSDGGGGRADQRGFRLDHYQLQPRRRRVRRQLRRELTVRSGGVDLANRARRLERGRPARPRRDRRRHVHVRQQGPLVRRRHRGRHVPGTGRCDLCHDLRHRRHAERWRELRDDADPLWLHDGRQVRRVLRPGARFRQLAVLTQSPRLSAGSRGAASLQGAFRVPASVP